MSMKPGVTTWPCASISCRARAVTRPISTMRPSLMAMSATKAGKPEPSTIRPPRTMRSKGTARVLHQAFTSRHRRPERALTFHLGSQHLTREPGVVVHCVMLRAAVVHDGERSLLPAKTAGELLSDRVLIQLRNQRRALEITHALE